MTRISCFALLVILFSCNREDDLPTRVVHGLADNTMVFPVDSFAKDLRNRMITVEGAELGTVAVVGGGRFIRFDPGPGFAGQSDVVRVFADGNALLDLTFTSVTPGSDCVTYAPSYDITLTTPAQRIEQLFTISFCGQAYENRQSPAASAFDLTPIVSAISVFSGRGVGFEFAPSSPLTHVAEMIYTLAYYKPNKPPEDPSDLSQYDLVISGMVRLRPAP